MDVWDMKQASRDQIRKYYRGCGYQAAIDREGHVQFRDAYPIPRHPRSWVEGGYVEQYYVDDRGNVHKI